MKLELIDDKLDILKMKDELYLVVMPVAFDKVNIGDFDLLDELDHDLMYLMYYKDI